MNASFSLISVLFLVGFLILSGKSNVISKKQGTNNWVTYEKGDSPIIIVASHDGDLTPSTMLKRVPGCLDTSVSPPVCIWEHNCEVPPNILQDSGCDVTYSRDSNTKDLALCIRNNAVFALGTHTYHPHYIYNNVHRNYSDTNRNRDEGCVGDSNCKIVWNEFQQFIDEASQAAENACTFGLVIDIHGHKRHNYTMIGYDLSERTLNRTNTALDSTTSISTVNSLLDNFDYESLSDIVRGSKSLGSLLLAKKSDWRVTPSLTFPNPWLVVGDDYLQGDFVIDTHGSKYGGVVDAIQIEVPNWIRSSSSERNLFCQHVSEAIVAWVRHWHSMRYELC